MLLITVTRLNKSQVAVNPELIETIESTPDTMISLIDGKKIIVLEKVEEVIEKIITYRRLINLPIEDKYIESQRKEE